MAIGKSEAFYVDDGQTLNITAKFQTRLSMRLQDSDGFTQPIEIGVGDLVQWRNLALIEIEHDLHQLSKSLDVLYPLKALDIRVKYRLVGRFMYDAVYNVGPQAFQDVREQDKENIDKFKQAYDLWEFYFDFSRGPMFLRVGRQNLSWGETDLFRMLDNINPLDMTFGGPFEDLDDRRIPLWMLRGSYNFGTVGPIRSCSLEGFWVPGNWDTRVAPLSPVGTPYSPPAPELPVPQVVVTPSKVMSNSRWGVRLIGILANNYNFSVGHYKTYLDAPSLRLAVGGDTLPDVLGAHMEVSYPDVQITGGSFSFWQRQTDVVVRTEVAWFWDEPVFIPEINTPMVPLPIPIPGFPGLPANGSIPKKDHLKWLIGLDKNVWIRALNKTNTFLFSFQWFASWVQDYDERMRFPAANYPDPNDFSSIKEIEHTFTGMIATSYLSGMLMPQMAMGYDPRGVWLLQPSVIYTLEPFRFGIQYSAIVGNMIGFGALRDRDQISFTFAYLLN
jgi:hypothetical protein